MIKSPLNSVPSAESRPTTTIKDATRYALNGMSDRGVQQSYDTLRLNSEVHGEFLENITGPLEALLDRDNLSNEDKASIVYNTLRSFSTENIPEDFTLSQVYIDDFSTRTGLSGQDVASLVSEIVSIVTIEYKKSVIEVIGHFFPAGMEVAELETKKNEEFVQTINSLLRSRENAIHNDHALQKFYQYQLKRSVNNTAPGVKPQCLIYTALTEAWDNRSQNNDSSGEKAVIVTDVNTRAANLAESAPERIRDLTERINKLESHISQLSFIAYLDSNITIEAQDTLIHNRPFSVSIDDMDTDPDSLQFRRDSHADRNPIRQIVSEIQSRQESDQVTDWGEVSASLDEPLTKFVSAAEINAYLKAKFSFNVPESFLEQQTIQGLISTYKLLDFSDHAFNSKSSLSDLLSKLKQQRIFQVNKLVKANRELRVSDQ